VLSLGVAPGTDLRIETTARNRDTSTAPDNTGVVRSDHAIREAGPATYATRLPVEALRAALLADGYPVRTSADAGGYLCNRLFYELMDRAPDLRMAGFVHVPALGDAWDLPRLSAAVRRILEALDAAAAP
jgi:pyroglutamyl-peptidase